MTYAHSHSDLPPLARLLMSAGRSGGHHGGPHHHRARGPFGREAMFGPGFGGPGPWARGRGRGRKRRGDVREALLRLLAEEPRNGYQLMQEIEERSDGRWRPSPGSVYPALAQLEDEGLVRAIERDGTKLFELTDTGREQTQSSAESPAPWAIEDDPDQSSAWELRSMIAQVATAAWQVAQAGDQAQIERALATLGETKRALYRILADDSADD